MGNLIVPGVLLLGFVIFVHELGHFLMAKWRGVRVLRFSLGFGPKLVGFTRGETEYRLAWIPFGGYVQMAGDSIGPENQMPGGRDEFLSHPWYGRILIAVAGPLANLITAFVVMCVVGMIGISYPDFPNLVGATPDSSVAWRAGIREGDRVVAVGDSAVRSWIPIFIAHSRTPKDRPVTVVVDRGGERLPLEVSAHDREPFFSSLRLPSTPPVVGSVVTGMPAYKAGIKEGDRVLAVNGAPIRSWDELPVALRSNVDKVVTLRVDREGKTYDLEVTPMSAGTGGKDGQIGIAPPRQGVYKQRHGALESIDLGFRATIALVGSVYQGMWLTLSRPLYYREYVGGPLFIAQAASEQARRGLDSYLQFLAMINVAIMAFNLMPLPILDGGHILLALVEAVRRHAISARAYLRFQQVGLVIMGTLLVLILANDPLRVVQRRMAIGKATPTTRTAPQPTSPEVPQETPVAPTPP